MASGVARFYFLRPLILASRAIYADSIAKLYENKRFTFPGGYLEPLSSLSLRLKQNLKHIKFPCASNLIEGLSGYIGCAPDPERDEVATTYSESTTESFRSLWRTMIADQMRLQTLEMSSFDPCEWIHLARHWTEHALFQSVNTRVLLEMPVKSDRKKLT